MRSSDKSGKKPIEEMEAERPRKGKLEHLKAESFDRKKVEEKLQKAEPDKEILLNALMEHVVYRDTEMRVLWANNAACESVGLTSEELTGRYCYEIWHGRSETCVVCPAIKAMKTGQRQEMQVKTPDERIWLIQAYPVRGVNGSITGSINTTLEITERKKAEEALRQSKEFNLNLLESSPNPIIVINPDTAIRYVNEALRKITGLSNEELIGKKSPYPYWTEETLEKTDREFKEALDKGAVKVEELFKTKKGERFWVQITSVAVKENAKLKYYLANWVNITERKKAEEALSESRNYLVRLTNSMWDAVFSVKIPGRVIEWVNDSFRLTGYEPEECIGRTTEFLYPNKEEFLDFGSKLKKAISEGKDVLHAEQVLRRKNGKIFPSEITTTLSKEKGKVIRVTSIVRDITERKKAEEELRKEKDKAQKYLDVAAVMLVAIDSEQRVGLINKKGCELLGYSEDEILGKNWFDNFLPERVRGNVKEIFNRVLRGKADVAEYYENPVSTKNGDERLIAWHNTILRDDKGNVIATLSSGEDITERKKAEEKIENLAKFPSENPYPVLRIAKNGTILYANQASISLLRDRNSGIGRSAPQDWQQLVEEVLQTGSVERREVEHAGRVFTIRAVPVINTHYVNFYGVDITERKQAEQRLRDYQMQLKSLASELTLAEERERHRIADGLHNQISQSLASSKIELDALRHCVSPKDPDQALKEVSDSLGKTIDDMRSLTFDISFPILYELGFETAVAAWLADRIQEKCGIATEFEDDEQPKPLDDDVRVFIFRDVRELLINVVRHAQAKKVKVSIRKVGSEMHVSVEDNGIGFDIKRVATTAVRAGGFGLFSIRERLEQLGGHLEIESTPGCGTKATLIAPLKQEKVDKGEKR